MNNATIFWGKVKRGKSRGKDLGFPTANIALHRIISDGLYLSKTKIKNMWYPALTFIGKAKTFHETTYQSETYILDFNKNFYGEWVTIKLIQKMRENKKFNSKEDLVKQMREDEKEAKKYFKLS